MNTKLLLIICLCAGFSGCATAVVTPLGIAKHSATKPEEIVVYVQEKDIPTPFERIGLLNVAGDWRFTKEGALISKVKAEAAKLGANAVLLKEVQEPATNAKMTDVLLAATVPLALPMQLERKQEAIALYIPDLYPKKERDTALAPSRTSATSPAAPEPRQP